MVLKNNNAHQIPSDHSVPSGPIPRDAGPLRNVDGPVPNRAARQKPQTGKKLPLPSINQMLEYRVWENEHFVQEVHYQKELCALYKNAFGKLDVLMQSMQQCLEQCQTMSAYVESEMTGDIPVKYRDPHFGTI